MNKLFGYIFFFSIISVLGMFMSVFIFQVGDELILTEIYNTANSTYDSLGISSEMQTHIGGALEDYRDLNIPYDLFFLGSFISIFGLSLFSAYGSREESYASFFGAITIGMMVFLVLTGFIVTIKDWIVLNLIQSVLSFDLTSTPMFFFYIDNMGFINFIWAFILIVINKLVFTLNRTDDEDFSSENGRFEQ